MAFKAMNKVGHSRQQSPLEGTMHRATTQRQDPGFPEERGDSTNKFTLCTLVPEL
jgi:hypothetical protein